MNDCVGSVGNVEVTLIGDSDYENAAGQMTFGQTEGGFQFLASVDHPAHIAAPTGAETAVYQQLLCQSHGNDRIGLGIVAVFRCVNDDQAGRTAGDGIVPVVIKPYQMAKIAVGFCPIQRDPVEFFHLFFTQNNRPLADLLIFRAGSAGCTVQRSADQFFAGCFIFETPNGAAALKLFQQRTGGGRGGIASFIPKLMVTYGAAGAGGGAMEAVQAFPLLCRNGAVLALHKNACGAGSDAVAALNAQFLVNGKHGESVLCKNSPAPRCGGV